MFPRYRFTGVADTFDSKPVIIDHFISVFQLSIGANFEDIIEQKIGK